MAEHDEALVAKAAEALVPWTPQPTDLANQEYRALCDAYREKAARAVLDAVAPAIEARALREAAEELPIGGAVCGEYADRRDNPDEWADIDSFFTEVGMEPAAHYPAGHAPACEGCASAEDTNHDADTARRWLRDRADRIEGA